MKRISEWCIERNCGLCHCTETEIAELVTALRGVCDEHDRLLENARQDCAGWFVDEDSEVTKARALLKQVDGRDQNVFNRCTAE